MTTPTESTVRQFLAREYYNHAAASYFCPACKKLFRKNVHAHGRACLQCGAVVRKVGPYLLLNEPAKPKVTRITKLVARMNP